MKNLILTLLLFLAIVSLFSCASVNITTASDTESSDATTAPPITTNEKGVIALPDEYYENPDKIYNASKIVIPAAYNQGLAFDIHPVIERGKVYFLLPSAVELKQVAYHLLDAKGNLIKGRYADFTDETSTDGKQVKIFGDSYEIIALRSDSPTLYLEIDEDYGTIEDVKADKDKETKAYGSLVLECRADIAEKYGWQTRYESRENDPDSPCTVYIKGRGNYTWNKTDKQGFSLKLEKKEDLLGMGKSKKWALVGNTTDPTMLRNTLAYYLGETSGLDYTPEGEVVDFFVNGEYFGAFALTEKIDIDEERVNIKDLENEIEALDPTEKHGSQRTKKVNNKLTIKYYSGVENPEDITGGYIIEYEMSDRYKDEPCGFAIKQGLSTNYYVIKSPEYASEAQVTYIATLVQNMEDAIYNKNGKHPTTGKPYTDFIDLDSLVRKYWIDEISKNFDGAKTSHYLYKPADSQSEKLFVGPVWDYDIAFGIRSPETVSPTGWYSRTEKKFYKACWQHEDFKALAQTTFFEIFKPAIETFADTLADTEADKIYNAIMMNEVIWNQLENKHYYTYVEELKSYILTRIEWISKELNK